MQCFPPCAMTIALPPCAVKRSTPVVPPPEVVVPHGMHCMAWLLALVASAMAVPPPEVVVPHGGDTPDTRGWHLPPPPPEVGGGKLAPPHTLFSSGFWTPDCGVQIRPAHPRFTPPEGSRDPSRFCIRGADAKPHFSVRISGPPSGGGSVFDPLKLEKGGQKRHSNFL